MENKKIVHKATNWDDEGNVTAVSCDIEFDNVEFAIENPVTLAILGTLTPCPNCFE